jgi:hypothetical protein
VDNLYFNLILEDMRSVYRDLSYFDLLRPTGLLFWIVLLSRDISLVDRRDQVSGLAYACYLAAAAVILLCVLPEYFVEPWSLTVDGVVATSGLIIGALRWNWGITRENYTKNQTSLPVIKPTSTDIGRRSERVRTGNSGSNAA